jgi:hypothetical protein
MGNDTVNLSSSLLGGLSAILLYLALASIL